ncbi:MAG: CgeB family protein, partial [Candidatus Binataceae bacterium]
MGRRCTISFFGSSLLSAYWNGAATYYRGIIRALNLRGHSITFYEPDAYGRQEHRDIESPPWARVVVYSARDERGALHALEAAQKSDLVLKCSGVGVFDDLLEREIANLSDKLMVGFWDVDAPATLDRIDRDPSDPFCRLIPKYHFVFTYGGGERVVQTYNKWGARLCLPVYNALDPGDHFPVSREPRFRADLAFLGNRLPDREQRMDEFFFGPAGKSPSRQFILGGNGWNDKAISDNVRYCGHVYTKDHNAFNSSPLCVLNVDRASMAEYGFCPPTRIFEAAGAEACIISDQWEGIEMFLHPGR